MVPYLLLVALVIQPNALVHSASIAQDDKKCTTPGETVPAGDGCNTCVCKEDGTLGICTIELCEPKPNIPTPEAQSPSSSECCFRYGFGAQAIPCCLETITCDEHDKLLEENKENPIAGGAFGKHKVCPKDAEEAHQLLSAQKEGEPCGLGIEEGKLLECRKDLECAFSETELLGTCQVKKEKTDCTISHDDGFNVTLGAICQGETKKAWNDIFDTQFKEENLNNCRKFCNCQKDCKGFTFNPNSEKRKCSWKADSPIETLTNEGIQKSGQSCVIKVPIACCRAITASCLACTRRQEIDGYCRNNPKTFGCTSKRCALPKQDDSCWLTGQNVTYLDDKSGECRTHIFNGCEDNGHASVSADPSECSNLNEGCTPCQVHRDSENARLSESPFPIIGAFVPECKESGHFQTKQRSGSSGYSFCYDKNGNKVESSDTPPGPPGLDCSIYVDEDGNRLGKKCTNPGESVPAGDGCNTCICNEDGTLGGCTLIACIVEISAHSEEKELDDLSDCCSNWSEKCAAIRIDCGKNKEPDCTDELPSDYLDSVCFNQWNFTSCEKIKKDVSGCNDLWLDTECTNHTGYIRDTCQKSCNNCKGTCDGSICGSNAVCEEADGKTKCSCPEGMSGDPFIECHSIECDGKECGTPCSEGICDKNGFCTSPEYNPCAVHGCDGKKCGETCLQGDISGVCDPYGYCNFDVASVIEGGQCDCKYVNASDPSFDPSKCGEQCGGNPFSDFTDFCAKGEKCCPSGPQSEECATKCGPYDQNETFGTCEEGCCKYQDAPCNLQCKENICHYADWVFEKYESFKKGPALANCDKCISDFSDAGGCECIKKEDCNQLSLVPDGCLPCGEQAIEHCGPRCSINVCDDSQNCTVFTEPLNSDVGDLVSSNITISWTTGPCCWKIYEKENFSGNYHVKYPGGTGLRPAYSLSIEAKSIKSELDCNVNPFECIDPPICDFYNEENAPDPNNPWENLIECVPTFTLKNTNETVENDETQNECQEKTKGVFDTCYSINPSYHVCVPSIEEECDVNDWRGKSCKGIGNIHSGMLTKICKEGKCEYNGVVIA